MNKWTQFFLNLAKTYSTQSKDISTKVGAVIAKGKYPISFGFNGFPRKVQDAKERLNDRETRLKYTLHAEVNAILSAKEDLKNTTIYVTMPPCIN